MKGKLIWMRFSPYEHEEPEVKLWEPDYKGLVDGEDYDRWKQYVIFEIEEG